MRAHIQDCNFLTRKRIRFRFKRFIQQFSQCCTTARDLKLKYLLCMESLEKSFYTESFQVREALRGPRVILVAADSGIQWCREKLKDSDEVGGVGRSVAKRGGFFRSATGVLTAKCPLLCCAGAAPAVRLSRCDRHQHQAGQQGGRRRGPSGHHQQAGRQDSGIHVFMRFSSFVFGPFTESRTSTSVQPPSHSYF